jgi:cytochrome c oxidase subunit 2
LFTSLGCASCHSGEASARGPNLAQVYGSRLQLADGSSVTANDAFLREAILNPSTRVTAGYAPIMPTYQGQVSEEGLIDLVEYIKNLNSNYRVQQTLTASQLPVGQAGASSSGSSSPAMNYRPQETLGAGHSGPAKPGRTAPVVPGSVNQ